MLCHAVEIELDLKCNKICKLPASSSCLGTFYDPYSFLNYQFLCYLVLLSVVVLNSRNWCKSGISCKA